MSWSTKKYFGIAHPGWTIGGDPKYDRSWEIYRFGCLVATSLNFRNVG